MHSVTLLGSAHELVPIKWYCPVASWGDVPCAWGGYVEGRWVEVYLCSV